MTLSSTTTRASYTANGVQTAFAYPFRIDDPQHLQVYLDDVLQNAGFTASGVGNDNGGNVTFNAAPAGGVNITLIRAVPLTQPTDLPTQGPLDTTAIEKRFDQVVMQVQGLRELIDRSLVLPPSSGALGLTLPALMASRVLAVNPGGDALEWAEVVEGDIVSDAMVPVVGGASLAAARNALGLGGLGSFSPADAMRHPLIGAAGTIVLGGPDPSFNSVLNPDCAVDQINAGAAVAVANGDDDKLCGPDGWKVQFSGSGAANISRVAAGITNIDGVLPAYALKVDVTTADASLAASDRHTVRLALEGHDVEWLRMGQAAAQTFTLSFFVKSPKTGIHEVAVLNSARSRSFVGQFTVAAASTWQRVAITIPGDTTGAWLTGTSTGLLIAVPLGCGTDFQAPAAGSWQAGAYFCTAAHPNILDTTSNDFLVTGLQIDPGSQMLPYRAVDMASSLLRCMRYIRVYGGMVVPGGGVWIATGQCWSTTHAEYPILFQPPLRAAPSMTASGNGDFVVRKADSSNADSTALGLYVPTPQSVLLDVTVASGLVAGNATSLYADATPGKLVFNAANA